VSEQIMYARSLWWNDYGNTETQQLVHLCLPADANMCNSMQLSQNGHAGTTCLVVL